MTAADPPSDAGDPAPDGADCGAGLADRRREVVRDAVGVGVATGAYGVSFGALAVAGGLSVAQACVLSLVMFTGASQFALVGVVAGGGNPLAGAATAVLLGTRNALYGLGLAGVLGVRGVRRAAAAQLVIDESAAMALGHEEPRWGRLAFWSTGLAVFICWNLATLLGGLGAQSLTDPATLGLDAAVPAAFLALLVPRLSSREPWVVAAAAAGVAVAATPLVGDGLPVLCAALVAVVAGLRGQPGGGAGGSGDEAAGAGPSGAGGAEGEA